MSTPPHQPASHLEASASLSPRRTHPISWITNYKGTTYVLDHHGRLQPTQRKASPMATTHIRNMTTDRQRDALRAVSEELHALALRRAEHRTEKKEADK